MSTDVSTAKNPGPGLPSGRGGPGSATWARVALWGLLGAVFVGYGVQMASPLRLNFDAVLLLKMVEAHQAGRGWNPPDVGSQHPIGYPMLVEQLDRLGVATPPVLVGVNIAFLALGLWASNEVLRRGWEGQSGQSGQLAQSGLTPHTRLVLVVLTACSWVMVKHASIPLTDVAYFGLSSAALLLLTLVWEGGRRPIAWRAGLFAMALILCAAGLLTRTVGITLLPAIAWSLVGQPERVANLAERLRRSPLIAGAVGLGAVVAGAGLIALVTRTTYWTGFVKQYTGSGVGEVLLNTAWFRLVDLGQVLLNVNEGSVPAPARMVLIAAGLGGYAALAMGLWACRMRITPAVVYWAAYSGLVLIWPFGDPRFWLPVLPLTGALLVTGLAPVLGGQDPGRLGRLGGLVSLGGLGRWIGWGYAAAFILLGIAAIGVTTRVSLSGDRFPSLFGSGVYSDSYRAAFGQPHNASKVFPEVVRLLQRFERRAFPTNKP